MRPLVVIGLTLILMACATSQEKSDELEQSKEYIIANTNVQLALGYLRQGRLDEAVVKLKKALAAYPDYRDAHITIALAYDHLGKSDLAEKYYLSSIDLDPDNGSVYNNYGVFLCSHNKVKAALANFMQAIETPRYPTPGRAYENAGSCAMKIPDIELAETYMRKALSINKKLPLALYTMAEITHKQKHYLSTRGYLQRYEEVGKYTSESLWLGVLTERALGNEEAQERYSKLLQTKFPDSLEYKNLLDKSWGGT